MYYFPGRGRAELIRWIFVQAGVPYEDKRVAGEEWAVFKPKTPFGTIPVLDIDGKLLAGSGPIARYLAEEFGLAGSNAVENCELASLYDVMDDLFAKLVSFFLEKDEARKATLKKDIDDTQLPKYLGILDKRIKDNGSSEGWIYGQKLTYIDLRVAVLSNIVVMVSGANVLDAYPDLAKLKATVEALPSIAKWIQERPKTEY